MNYRLGLIFVIVFVLVIWLARRFRSNP